MTMVAEANCHNCGAAVHGRFCASCGQEFRPLDPTLGELAREIAHELSTTDGRIFRSARRLFVSPGFLTCEYLAGRRAAWLSPVRLYLTFSVLFFGVASLTGQSPIDFNLTISGGPNEDPAEALRTLERLGFASAAALDRWINDALGIWIPRAMFVLVPVFAWLVSRADRRGGRKLPQHLIFALHVHAAAFGSQAIVLAGRWLAGPLAESVLGGLSAIYVVSYVGWALWRVYGGTAWQVGMRTAAVLLAYWAAVVVTSLAIVGLLLLWRLAS